MPYMDGMGMFPPEIPEFLFFVGGREAGEPRKFASKLRHVFFQNIKQKNLQFNLK